jgi:hypothetical protein
LSSWPNNHVLEGKLAQVFVYFYLFVYLFSFIHLSQSEAARLADGRCTEPETNEVCELLEQWLSTDPENVCLHGEPVFWSHSIGAVPANKENTY